MTDPVSLRQTRCADHAEIDHLLSAAFGRSAEADLVRRLRVDGDMWLELAASWQGVVAGYAALSRMRAPRGWACLAPVAVLPRFQRGAGAPDDASRHAHGIGTRLIRGIATAVVDGTPLPPPPVSLPRTVVVLGEPGFYGRAGFNRERARHLVSPYPIEFTLIARPGCDAPAERLVYPRAFDGLE